MVFTYKPLINTSFMLWVLVAGIVVVLLLLIACSRLKFLLRFCRQGGNERLTVDFQALFGLIQLRFAIPMVSFTEKGLGIELKTELFNAKTGNLIRDQRKSITMQKIKQGSGKAKDARVLMQHCYHFHDWVKGCLAQVHITRLDWKTSIGIGDAAETAFTVGAVWGLKTSLLRYIFRFVRLHVVPELQVVPVFNQTKFETEGLCQVYIRVASLLWAGLQLLVRIIQAKNGLRTWLAVLQRKASKGTA